MGKLCEAKLNYLVASLEDINFGSVVITVHDGSITQIDTTEKKRFSKPESETQQKRTLKS